MHPTPRGDEHELFHCHHRKLVETVRGRFQISDDEARDVVQFAWMKFIEVQPVRANVFGWLYTTAKHEVYARTRRCKREQPVDRLPDRDHEPDLFVQLDQLEVARLLRTTMRERLTDNQRAALTLWSHGYRYKEIAHQLGKTYTWANRHIGEGLQALRRAVRTGDRPEKGGEPLRRPA